MAKEADAIAAGDLTRRVQPTEGDGEIARLGRALNGMLDQIETAFAQRALSEDRLRSFLADASHELRTPLTSIRGYAELLQKDALVNEPARDRALSRIEKEAARMGVLVGDLAVLAREGEGPEPARHRVDLAAVAAEAVADARDPRRRPGPSSSRADHGEVPVAGDDARLGQMIHNLLGNALAHTPDGHPGGGRGGGPRRPTAVLQVRDHGPGMTAEQASHVFDRFYRGDAERLDGGSGLGLFIVASLARTFGGGPRWTPSVGRGGHVRGGAPGLRPRHAGERRGNRSTDALATIDRGSGPPVVLLHGQPGSGASWDPVTGCWSPTSGCWPPTAPATGPRPARPAAWPATPTWSPSSSRSGGRPRPPSWPTAGPAGRPSCWRSAVPTVVRSLVLVGAACTPDCLNALDRWLTVPVVGDALTVVGLAGHRRRAPPPPALRAGTSPTRYRPQVETALPDRGVTGGDRGALGPAPADLHDRAAGPHRRAARR